MRLEFAAAPEGEEEVGRSTQFISEAIPPGGRPRGGPPGSFKGPLPSRLSILGIRHKSLVCSRMEIMTYDADPTQCADDACSYVSWNDDIVSLSLNDDLC